MGRSSSEEIFERKLPSRVSLGPLFPKGPPRKTFVFWLLCVLFLQLAIWSRLWSGNFPFGRGEKWTSQRISSGGKGHFRWGSTYLYLDEYKHAYDHPYWVFGWNINEPIDFLKIDWVINPEKLQFYFLQIIGFFKILRNWSKERVEANRALITYFEDARISKV
jgi:hypothetical protein